MGEHEEKGSLSGDSCEWCRYDYADYMIYISRNNVLEKTRCIKYKTVSANTIRMPKLLFEEVKWEGKTFHALSFILINAPDSGSIPVSSAGWQTA